MSAGVCWEHPLILLGAGGHAKVLLALVREAGWTVRGVCDPGLAQAGIATWLGVPVMGGDEALDSVRPDECGLLHGIGQLVGQSLRRTLYERMRERGFRFPAVVHPTAWVAPDVSLAEGVQIMAGAILQPDCLIGENTIINTRAVIDHDCVVGRHVHVAPAATLCGGVCIGDRVFVGSGATLIQGLRVGADAVIGAGTTLRRDLPEGAYHLGLRTGSGSTNEAD